MAGTVTFYETKPSNFGIDIHVIHPSPSISVVNPDGEFRRCLSFTMPFAPTTWTIIPMPFSLFSYIEIYYNRRRRHSTNGYQSPAKYEFEWGKMQNAA